METPRPPPRAATAPVPWTSPLELDALSRPPASRTPPRQTPGVLLRWPPRPRPFEDDAFDFEEQFRHVREHTNASIHDAGAPHVPGLERKIAAFERRFARRKDRIAARPSRPSRSRSFVADLTDAVRAVIARVPPTADVPLRLNRLHGADQSSLSVLAPAIRREFRRMSSVAREPRREVVDEYDERFCELQREWERGLDVPEVAGVVQPDDIETSEEEDALDVATAPEALNAASEEPPKSAEFPLCITHLIERYDSPEKFTPDSAGERSSVTSPLRTETTFNLRSVRALFENGGQGPPTPLRRQTSFAVRGVGESVGWLVSESSEVLLDTTPVNKSTPSAVGQIPRNPSPQGRKDLDDITTATENGSQKITPFPGGKQQGSFLSSITYSGSPSASPERKAQPSVSNASGHATQGSQEASLNADMARQRRSRAELGNSDLLDEERGSARQMQLQDLFDSLELSPCGSSTNSPAEERKKRMVLHRTTGYEVTATTNSQRKSAPGRESFPEDVGHGRSERDRAYSPRSPVKPKLLDIPKHEESIMFKSELETVREEYEDLGNLKPYARTTGVARVKSRSRVTVRSALKGNPSPQAEKTQSKRDTQNGERARSLAYAIDRRDEGREPKPGQRRNTTVARTKRANARAHQTWIARKARSQAKNVRRRFDTFKNIMSADDY